MSAEPKLMTADELLATPSPGDGVHYELVKGGLIEMRPTGEPHSSVAGTISVIVSRYVRAKRLGRIYNGEGGFILAHTPIR